jgi:hypothetical protein
MAIFCQKKSHVLYLDNEFLLGSQNKAGFLSKFYFAVGALVQFGSFLLWMMASPPKNEDIKSLTKWRKKNTLLLMNDDHLLTYYEALSKNFQQKHYSVVGNPDPSISQLDKI